MALAEEDLKQIGEYVKRHIGDWIAEQSLGKPPVVYEIERLRLGADQPGASPAQPGIGGKLALVGANIDDGCGLCTTHGGVLLLGGEHALENPGGWTLRYPHEKPL